MADRSLALGNRKLVVLGLPWEVDTNGLKLYMSRLGALEDVVVMKDRKTGRSRGFGYVTFSSSDDAEKALASQHVLNGRTLDLKIATPKEDTKVAAKGITRIFVARIPTQVTQEEFRSYFEEFGTITDIYLPKDQSSNSHRGIGFITYESPDSVEEVMAQTHELGGTTIAVDQATPKEGSGKEFGNGKLCEPGFGKKLDPVFSGAYGAYSPYIAAAANAARLAALSVPQLGFDYSGLRHPGDSQMTGLGAGYGGSPGVKDPTGLRSAGLTGAAKTNKIFVGRLPSEVTSNDLQTYFSRFGQILDIYLPKDPKRTGHKGFGFVTFTNESAVGRVALRSHELLGQQIAVEMATPLEEMGGSRKGGGSMRGLSSATMFPGSSNQSDFSSWLRAYGGSGGVGPIYRGPFGESKASKIESRYMPYKK